MPLYTNPQPQQEPVIDKSAAIRIATALGWEPMRGWVGVSDERLMEMPKQEQGEPAMKWDASAPLVMSPHPAFQQRTWVGLTDKEAMQICEDCGCLSEDWLILLDAIEAKLRSKNT